MNDTGLLFDVEDELLARPARSVPAPVVAASEEDFTPVAGVALWGPVLDRLFLAPVRGSAGPKNVCDYFIDDPAAWTFNPANLRR